MLATTMLVGLCVGATVFYVGFMIALCRECELGKRGYWVRLRQGVGSGGEVVELPFRKPAKRAA